MRRVFCGGCEKCCYTSLIAALLWPAAVDEIYCGVLQQRYINHYNIRVLAALDLVIAAVHKPATINISLCGILQWRYIKLLQYISFSGIFVTYSGGLDDHYNRYFFAALFRSYSSGFDHCNRPFNCLHLVQCIPLLFWPKGHFAFSFRSFFIFQYTLSLVSLKKKKIPHCHASSLSKSSLGLSLLALSAATHRLKAQKQLLRLGRSQMLGIAINNANEAM